jgi:hypothetical protein
LGSEPFKSLARRKIMSLSATIRTSPMGSPSRVQE